VLTGKLGLEEHSARIFPVSARGALAARRDRDSAALAASGLPELERALVNELVAEKQAIAFATSRSRATGLVAQLLYRAELERKALVTTESELVQKITEFEDAVSCLQTERRDLSDFMGVDRRRLLTELTETTDRLWAEGRAKFAGLAKAETPTGFDDREVRVRLGRALEEYFDEAARRTIEQARAELVSRLAKHEAAANALLARVRKAATDLTEISVNFPPAEQAFELGKEPYWAAPAPANSILNASVLAFMRWMPRSSRERAMRPDRHRYGKGGPAQRREPRVGAAPEPQGGLPTLRDVAIPATFCSNR
jgi:uncharacterized protein YejL (UPF0352 family)